MSARRPLLPRTAHERACMALSFACLGFFAWLAFDAPGLSHFLMHSLGVHA